MPDKLLSFKACLASNTVAEDHKKLVCPLTGPEGCPLRTFYLSPVRTVTETDCEDSGIMQPGGNTVSHICKIINVTSIYFINKITTFKYFTHSLPEGELMTTSLQSLITG